ncbi:uncharacterized protein LOC121243906 [Juglans microcarpa x Juglans regia]|uniref:uncharacterized protein LOC121243906 n=1 Tax=Juglans microcarpa x Juglans regia TaxID=2249226 RepID=UPI001B7F429D|nr:uncharacterized protein LOC121243906 [Juglans microcarpa x Juglans regia]
MRKLLVSDGHAGLLGNLSVRKTFVVLHDCLWEYHLPFKDLLHERLWKYHLSFIDVLHEHLWEYHLPYIDVLHERLREYHLLFIEFAYNWSGHSRENKISDMLHERLWEYHLPFIDLLHERLREYHLPFIDLLHERLREYHLPFIELAYWSGHFGSRKTLDVEIRGRILLRRGGMMGTKMGLVLKIICNFQMGQEDQ